MTQGGSTCGWMWRQFAQSRIFDGSERGNNFASSAEFVGGFALPIWFFDLCSAQAQAYPPSLPVGKPTCLLLAHRRLVHRCEALGG
jgi:hypothetical protein